MEARIAEVSGGQVLAEQPEVVEVQVQDKQSTASTRSATESNSQILSGVVAGMDKFINTSSALGGIGDDMESDSGSESEGEEEEEQPTVPRPDGCDTVFVGNLAPDVTEDQIYKLFGRCGKIAAVRYSISQGLARVQYVSGDCTVEAVQKSGMTVNGRPIRVDYMPPTASKPTPAKDNLAVKANSKIRGAMVSSSGINPMSPMASPAAKAVVVAEAFNAIAADDDSDDDADAGALWKRNGDDAGSQSPPLPDIASMNIQDPSKPAPNKEDHDNSDEQKTSSRQSPTHELADRAETLSPFEPVLHLERDSRKAVTDALEIDPVTVLAFARGKKPSTPSPTHHVGTPTSIDAPAQAQVSAPAPASALMTEMRHESSREKDTPLAPPNSDTDVIERVAAFTSSAALAVAATEAPAESSPSAEVSGMLAVDPTKTVDDEVAEEVSVSEPLVSGRVDEDLIAELTRLGLLDPPDEEEADSILRGDWNLQARKKLEVRDCYYNTTVNSFLMQLSLTGTATLPGDARNRVGMDGRLQQRRLHRYSIPFAVHGPRVSKPSLLCHRMIIILLLHTTPNLSWLLAEHMSFFRTGHPDVWRTVTWHVRSSGNTMLKLPTLTCTHTTFWLWLWTG
jgi:hypothetical protein